MSNCILSLISGLAVGVLFKVAGLPMPAPVQFAGVLAIVGLYLGYSVVNWSFN